MKTLKEEVMELLMNRIGVVEDEEFKASNIDEPCFTYKISKDKLLFKNLSEEWDETERWVDFIRCFECYKFNVKPFKPTDDSEFWCIDVNGNVNNYIFDHKINFSCLNRAIGNCFRTKESAEAHKEEILKILKGEDDE